MGVGLERAGDDLCAAALQAGREGATWAEGLRRALRVLLEFVAEQPATAAALLTEVRAAGAPAPDTRKRLVERLAHALDSARRQPGSRHSAPPLTADLMVGGITNTLQGLLVKGEAARAPELLGDLTYLVMLSYFDADVAYAEMDAAEAEA